MSPEDIDQTLEQPLLDEYRELNPLCLAELEEVILKEMGHVHERKRLLTDPEWNTRKNRWTTRREIVAAFMKGAVESSVNDKLPEDLDTLANYLFVALKRCSSWSVANMAEVSLIDISSWLVDILWDVEAFQKWNSTKLHGSDFIDLHAVILNTCINIRDSRRRDSEFNREFEERQYPPEYCI